MISALRAVGHRNAAHMDGFDLVRNMRSDERLAGLPVIMIASRIAQKHRDYAAELDVKHYLGKPYSE
jgi:chemosensory pili system protein ChpA (sensor histidine kinase/response regulator)